jgi:potassium efflux system protein
MKALRSLALSIGAAGLWPLYLLLVAYAVRVSPFPHVVTRPGSFAVLYVAASLLVAALGRFVFGPGGWLEHYAALPPTVARQLRRAIWTLVGAGLVLLLPDLLLQNGLIAPGERPVVAPAIGRLLGLGFELVVWVVAWRLVRLRSPLVQWFLEGAEGGGWLGRHRRVLSVSLLAVIGSILVLDAHGYAFTAHRVATACGQAVLLALACWSVYRVTVSAIDQHAWRWIRSSADPEDPSRTCRQEELAARLRHLTAWVVPVLALVCGAWIWNFDTALFQYVGDIPLWTSGGSSTVKVADLTKAVIVMVLAAGAWRSMNDLFTVAVFPRMPDDAGLRYAMLTLCRYFVLAVGALVALSAVHLGLDKIGMVLAALGVGLGFGLQEIVSNFVSGIILLVERPIRVGDVVTVAGMSGRVDKIHIRATTIINSDNQSMIVPNREFITSSLVNWTHKDRIVRVAISLNVAYGHDVDRVSGLLLAVADEDDDVLRNPVPSASMEGFGDSALKFGLSVFVADPSLSGRVRHRLCGRIQSRLREAGIEIAVPVTEFHVRSYDASPFGPPSGVNRRQDLPSETPPPPRFRHAIPAPAEESHRGVDE